MEKLGVVINVKKLYVWFVMLIIGLSLMFYGIIQFSVDQKKWASELTDQEIIARAKALGMVEIKDKLEEEVTNDKSQ